MTHGQSPVRPYGSWASPLSPEALAGASLRIGEVITDRDTIYWAEGRPTEGGRGVVVTRNADGSHRDVTPADSNVRTLVHEYGGGAWTVSGGVVFHVELTDQQVHATDASGTRQITDEAGSRFADLRCHPDGAHLLAVRESHGDDGGEPSNDIVAIRIDDGTITSLYAGSDFVSSPRPSPDGNRIAFISWDHPNMPWDHTELRIYDWAAQQLVAEPLIAGEAVQQPTWDGSDLVAITDRTGWWIPHRVGAGEPEPLFDASVDAGVPHWVFGLKTLEIVDGRTLVVWEADGIDHIGFVEEGSLRELEVEFNEISSPSLLSDGSIVAGTASPHSPRGVSIIAPDGSVTPIHDRPPAMDPGAVSVAEHISFESFGRTAHALFYRPISTETAAPDDEAPPLLVLSHGGPTSSARPGFDLGIQFWTTRGFAVVDVNYGGSTGYGREYRNLLRDSWGIVDVQDCISAARYLAEKGEADGDRLLIKGGSAGGYSTLAALAFHDVFAAGASRYGIGDLETLARDTHKFESRYLDGLIGPYPEARDIYVERSPIHSVEAISAPMIVLQGSEDKVVPPNQAEDIVAALAAQGIPHSYVLFEGEQHGFRDAANIARAVEAEYVFFCRVFGIEPSGSPEPLHVVGLD